MYYEGDDVYDVMLNQVRESYFKCGDFFFIIFNYVYLMNIFYLFINCVEVRGQIERVISFLLP